MQTIAALDQNDVKTLLDTAMGMAHEKKLGISVAVCDAGGYLLGMFRTDTCATISSVICVEKARTAALARRESKYYEDAIANGRNAFLSLPLDGLLEGGVPVMVNGQCAGAVGVSGLTKEEDAHIAKTAIAALNLG